MTDNGVMYVKFIYKCNQCPLCLNIGYNEYYCEDLKEKFIGAETGINKNCKLEKINKE